MKKISKVLSLVLALLMLTGAFCINSFAAPTEIEAGNSLANAKNLPNFGTEYVSSLSKAGEVDWFKFTTKSEDAYYFINLENYNIDAFDGIYYGLQLYLYDKYENEFAHINAAFNSSKGFNIRLESNTTYYFKVQMGDSKKDSTGNYEITVSARYDNVPNTKANAKSINFNSKVVSSLDGTGDVDWFSVTTPNVNEKYTFILNNNDIYALDSVYYGLHLYLYDKYDKELGHIYVVTGKDKSFEVSLEANTTYYFKILMGSSQTESLGTYEVTVKADGIPTPDPATKYTITYNANGGSVSPTSQTVEAGVEFTLPLATRDGYTFLGWANDKNATTPTVKVGEKGKINSNVTVYAIWQKNATPDTPDTPDEPSDSGVDIGAILSTIWSYIVKIFNWVLSILSEI